jgi:hypothetical protein
MQKPKEKGGLPLIFKNISTSLKMRTELASVPLSPLVA